MRPSIQTLRDALEQRGFLTVAARLSDAHEVTLDDVLLGDRRRRGVKAARAALSKCLGVRKLVELLPFVVPAIPLVLAPCLRVEGEYARRHCTCAGCLIARPYRLTHRWDVNRERARRRYHRLKARGVCPRCMGPNKRRSAECHDCSNERSAA